MTPLLASYLFEYALNTLWQLPLLAASTWLLIRLTRPSVALQHALWIATLLLAATLPLRGSAPAAPQTTVSLPSHSLTTAPSLSSPHLVLLTPRLILRIAQLWLALLAFSFLRLTLAWLTARCLIAQATPSTLDATFLAACAARLNIPRPEILVLPASNQTAIPAVAGLFHPVLLLPQRFEHDYELTAILLHEFAHIRRRDTLVNLLCRLVALPIAWHPITPIFHARIGQTRELLCDALAARAAGSSIAYARSLLTLARSMQQSDIHSNPAILGLYRSPSHLEVRIMKLITPPASTPASRAARIAAGVTLIAIATCTAAAFHLQAVVAAQTSQRIPQVSTPTASLQSDNGSSGSSKSSASAVSSSPGSSQSSGVDASTSSSHDAPQTVSSPPSQGPNPPRSTPSPATPAGLEPTLQSTPTSTPTSQPTVFVNGVQHDLTPAEQADLDKKLAKINEQVRVVLNQHLFDQQQLKLQLKSLNIPEVHRQIAEAQKQINSPEFRRQIADAQKLAIDKAVNSDEIRRQMDQAIQQIKIAQANMAKEHINIQIDQAQMQQQLKAASDALAHAKIDVHIDSAQIQKQLEAARKQLEDAHRNNQPTTPQP